MCKSYVDALQCHEKKSVGKEDGYKLCIASLVANCALAVALVVVLARQDNTTTLEISLPTEVLRYQVPWNHWSVVFGGKDMHPVSEDGGFDDNILDRRTYCSSGEQCTNSSSMVDEYTDHDIWDHDMKSNSVDPPISVGNNLTPYSRSPSLSHIFESSTDQPDTNALLKQVVSRTESAFLVNISQPLGPDPSVANRTKSICYFMIGTDNNFRKLSQDFFIQPTLYNDNPKQGGLNRHYKLLSDDVVGSSPMMKILNFFREHFSLPPGTVVLCQIQSSLEEEIKDDITEQGIHTDGAEDAMVLCLERKNVDGAENLLYKDVYGKYPLIPPTVLEEGEAIFWNDNRVYHGVTPMSPENPDKGPAVRTVMLLHANSDYLLDGRKNEKNTLPGRK